MMSKEIISYIEDPSQLNENSIFDLTLIAEKYPYFQAAQLLRVRNLSNLSPEAVKPILNYTAAYVTDRKILYYLLHPIKEEKQVEVEVEAEFQIPKSPEKDIKDTIGENISDALNNQISYVKNNREEAIEFSTAINVKKEYGEGIQLDEYVVRINETTPEFIELIEDDNKEVTEENIEKEEIKVEEKKKPSTNKEGDILTLISKGMHSEIISESENLNAAQIKHNSIIDSFIQANPKIKPGNPANSEIKDFSKESVEENDHLITDTLANIYKKQGNYAKAIFAYEKLSLKYPEKSAYFADQILEIKKLIEKSK